MIDHIDSDCFRAPAAAAIRMALWIAVLLALLRLPSTADADDGMPHSQKSRNYAAAPIVVSNPSIGSGVGATAMYFYDVGSDGQGQPRSSAQVVGAYTNTDSYFIGLLNSLHLRDDRIRSKAGLFHAKINNESEDQFPCRCGRGQRGQHGYLRRHPGSVLRHTNRSVKPNWTGGCWW